MKVGSLVIALEDFYNANVWYIAKDTIVEIRTIGEGRFSDTDLPGVGLRFIGIYNGLAPNGKERSYDASRFKEIQPPMEISIEEILEEKITI